MIKRDRGVCFDGGEDDEDVTVGSYRTVGMMMGKKCIGASPYDPARDRTAFDLTVAAQLRSMRWVSPPLKPRIESENNEPACGAGMRSGKGKDSAFDGIWSNVCMSYSLTVDIKIFGEWGEDCVFGGGAWSFGQGLMMERRDTAEVLEVGTQSAPELHQA